MTANERARILAELHFQLSENQLSQLMSVEHDDRDAYLYNVGVEDGLRALAAALLTDISLLRNPIRP